MKPFGTRNVFWFCKCKRSIFKNTAHFGFQRSLLARVEDLRRSIVSFNWVNISKEKYWLNIDLPLSYGLDEDGSPRLGRWRRSIRYELKRHKQEMKWTKWNWVIQLLVLFLFTNTVKVCLKVLWLFFILLLLASNALLNRGAFSKLRTFML